MNEKTYVAPEATVVEFEEKDLLLLSFGGGDGQTPSEGWKNW